MTPADLCRLAGKTFLIDIPRMGYTLRPPEDIEEIRCALRWAADEIERLQSEDDAWDTMNRRLMAERDSLRSALTSILEYSKDRDACETWESGFAQLKIEAAKALMAGKGPG